MSLEDAIEACDKLREELEGVGLSDALVKCIELAYAHGVVSAINQNEPDKAEHSS